jgi:serine/threonine protein kinase
MALEVGQVFAGYTILRLLGVGGMGQVYLATHPRLPREDALKVLPPDLTTDPEYRGRFAREAELAATLSHPHIVGIHDRGEFDGQFWISMEYVAGTDVGKLLLDQFPNGMPVDEALPILSAVASALDYAHRRGLLHRDVKPSNILLSDPDGQARRAFLADFGIARRIDDSAGLTATNMTVGTVAYAPPEQLKAEAVDGRTDQYALACSAFHVLAGAPPFVHSNPAVVITQHVTAPPPSIGARRPEIAGLDGVFARAMAKQPSRRFGSCSEFVAVLSDQLSGGASPYVYETQPYAYATLPPDSSSPALPRKRSGRRTGIVIAALVVVVFLIAGGVFAAVKLTQSNNPTANPSPFGGTYRADFGSVVPLDVTPDQHEPPVLTSTYGFRSTCRSTGCVMTASRLSGEPLGEATTVFDQIGERWVAVSLHTDKCQSTPAAEYWVTFAVKPRPDGTLAGEYTQISNAGCIDRRFVSFTRTGDVDVNSVPDPASQQPRVVSPAAALHGRYSVLRTFASASKLPPQQSVDSAITDCLRTGDRCMSYFYGETEVMMLVFGAGKWVWDVAGEGNCSGAGVTRLKDTAQYPLPEPPQNPITRFTGHGHHQQGAPCAIDTDFDQTFTRTGD